MQAADEQLIEPSTKSTRRRKPFGHIFRRIEPYPALLAFSLPERSATYVSFPSPLTHSWPLFEQHQHFDLGSLLDAPEETLAEPEHFAGLLAAQGAGLWECDLTDNSLSWTDGVFDLFGLPRGAAIKRDEMVALYAEPSRAAMERLRAHAIKHRRGFTLDAEIVPVTGPRRWMRLIAAPICDGPRVVRLHGIKQDVSAAYL